MKKIVLIYCFCFTAISLSAQDCKVLLKNINQTYTGDCKKGKADGNGTATGVDQYTGSFKKGYPDGKGVYTFKDGSVFKGTFKKGKREGEGIMTYKIAAAQDSLVEGFWKKDSYVGRYEKPYKKIDNSPNVTAVRFTNIDKNQQKVRLYIRKDNFPVPNSMANIVVHHGTFKDIRNQKDYVELTNVTFPLKFRATYQGNFIEVELFQAGLWNVQMTIENIRGLENKN